VYKWNNFKVLKISHVQVIVIKKF